MHHSAIFFLSFFFLSFFLSAYENIQKALQVVATASDGKKSALNSMLLYGKMIAFLRFGTLDMFIWAQDYNASLNLRSTLTKDGKFSI